MGEGRLQNDAPPVGLAMPPGLVHAQVGRRRPPLPADATGRSTVARTVRIEGTGLHGGVPATLALHPARAGTGVVFHRVDLGPDARVPARHDLVADTRLCTLVADPDRPAVRVGTIEHLMAAIAARGIDDVLVAIDGPEVPVLDGSSVPFMALLRRAGRTPSGGPLLAIAVRRPVRVDGCGGFASLLPAPHFSLAVSIDFESPAIGRQELALDEVTETTFLRELAPARTFTLAHEIERLRAAGLARGGSLDNAVVVDGARVLNPGGLRMEREFVRHKALDAVGDLRLAGSPILGRYVAHRPGHALNNQVLHALLADRRNWSFVPAALPAASGRDAA